ncbi:MAG: alcohol dehydrogenase catalytic domain-containing protein [Spirochaetia bacterium]|jgi:2-desacetyl-2-hydroxyethyl bacteriochlorophyllide A dehydrogenase
MKAALWLGKGKIEVASIEKPLPGRSEVLLRVLTAGICGTDLSIYAGKFDPKRSVPPMVPGHEICGVIEALGADVSGWSVGERVAVNPLISCGTCYACRSGFPHVCRTLKLIGVDRNGGFAQHVTAGAHQLYRLPEGVSDIAGAMVEPVSVAVHDYRMSRLAVGGTALVIGAGPIGILIAMVARRAGARRIVLSEVNEYRLGVARDLGFDARHPAQERFREGIVSDFDGVGPDVAFEVTGSAAGYQAAIDSVRVRGTVVQVGIPHGGMSTDLRRINFAELSIVGTRVYEPLDYVTAIDLLAGGAIAADAVSSTHELAECGTLFAELTEGTARRMKPIFRIG